MKVYNLWYEEKEVNALQVILIRFVKIQEIKESVLKGKEANAEIKFKEDKMKLMKRINRASVYVAGIGGLNWLTTALLDFDIVTTITDAVPTVTGLDTIFYSLLGAAGVWIGILALQKKIIVK